MKVSVSPHKAVARFNEPAYVTVDLGAGRHSVGDYVELTVRALKVDPQRKFVVTASNSDAGLAEQVGELAFYPPARSGKTYKLRVEMPKSQGPVGDNKFKLAVAIIPLSAQLGPSDASIEVLSARLLRTVCK
jgi:hypothetical protein